MKLSRRRFLVTSGASMAAPAVFTSSVLAQSIVTLKLHHFLSPVANGHSKMLAPWARGIEADSQSKIKIEIYPSMQLGGTPAQLYDQVRDGVADIVWTLPGNTPGRFPSTEAIELPFVVSPRGLVNARACQEYADAHLGNEVKDVKLLSYWAHDRGVIHANKPINTADDLKGLKLRTPTRLAGEALKALGAVPVGLPPPQVPESLAQGVIQGAVFPWEIVPAIKLHEMVKFHTEIPGTPSFYTGSFFLAMNKAKYEGLPAELRAVVDKNSGMAFAELAGRMWDAEAVAVVDFVKKQGNAISSISREEKAQWSKATEPVHAAWIDYAKGKGLDGAKLIASARALIAKHDIA
jgi:TRAP-type C4-dicarboxylate transport system substrate-binding protein